MKKLALTIAVVLLTVNIGFADEEKPSILKKILETAISPIDTILGPVTELERIVVTPSRVEEKLGASSSSISVIDTGDFDRRRLDTAKDALRTETGLGVVQSGAFQGTTSIFTRGGNSNHTLIMIDGVKAYDPISPNGAYNLAHLTLDNIDRIEILRGPQSALYGSDAMSGVINIISKKPEEPYVNASYEAGSFFTHKEDFEVGANTKGFHYSIAASRLDTKGISQLEAKNNNQERDPYGRTAVATRIDYDLQDLATIGGTLRYTNARFEYDDTVTSSDDDNSVSRYREVFLTTYITNRFYEWWHSNLHLGWMEVIRQNFDDDPPSDDYISNKYYGRYFKLDFNNIINIMDVDNVVIGYDYNEEIGDYFTDYAHVVYDQPKVFSREGGLYIENRFNLADRLTSTQGIRISHHSKAGTFETYRLDGSYLLATGTKIRGLIASGFKAPTLYQLFAVSDPWFGGGNPNLRPEKSLSYEYGLDQYLFGEKVILNTTYFHTVYRDLIDAVFNPNTWVTDQYANVGKARVHGIEISSKVKPISGLTLQAGFTYQKTKNLQDDRDLLRRPVRKFFIEGFWQATKNLSLDLRLRYNGPMSDSGGYKIKEYTVVDLITNYDLTKNFSIYAKFNNLLDQHYEEVTGFGTPGFAAYGGVKARF